MFMAQGRQFIPHLAETGKEGVDIAQGLAQFIVFLAETGQPEAEIIDPLG